MKFDFFFNFTPFNFFHLLDLVSIILIYICFYEFDLEIELLD
jgi:hypothetical protein